MTSGINPERAQRIRRSLNTYIEDGMIAGAVALVCRRGQIALHEAFGFSDRERQQPMAQNSLFRIASMTKPVTSVAALMLIEDGALRLDDPIERWLPEFSDMRVALAPFVDLGATEPATARITVRNLLLHRAGLAYPVTASGALEQALREFNSDVLPAVAPDRWIETLGRLPLCAQPGERWHYGFATDLLGMLIGRVAGCAFPDFLREKIFAPLEMHDTAFWVAPDDAQRLATPYVFDPASGQTVVYGREDARRWLDPESFPSGGAGLVSTASDYLNFARMLAGFGVWKGRRLLGRKSVELMVMDHLTAEERARPFLGQPYWKDQGFGFGVSVVDNPVHSQSLSSPGTIAWPGAFGCSWLLDYREDLIAILMLQLYWGSHCKIGVDFQNAVYQSLDD